MTAFEFIGGARPLDFVNTVSWGDGGEERLHDYEDFLAWCRAASLPIGKGRDPRVLRKALKLRAALHAAFLRGDSFDAFLQPALRQLTLRRGTWTLRDPNHPDAPLWWLTWEAANLLASEAIVRRCSNDRCLWLFIDASRRHNRRWCDMQVCGSRAKSRAYYERLRAR
jgi:predicted RNA-binding Zn ribbon-like protein